MPVVTAASSSPAPVVTGASLVGSTRPTFSYADAQPCPALYRAAAAAAPIETTCSPCPASPGSEDTPRSSAHARGCTPSAGSSGSSGTPSVSSSQFVLPARSVLSPVVLAGDRPAPFGREQGYPPGHLASTYGLRGSNNPSTSAPRRRFRERRVAVVQHERVALGVAEVGHVANAAVDRVAGERHTARLELRPSRADVVDLQGDRHAVRAEVDSKRLRGDHGDRHVARLELGARGRLIA